MSIHDPVAFGPSIHQRSFRVYFNRNSALPHANHLRFSQGERFFALVQDLPCVVEAWKTYNDADLVKSGDIGQVIIVQEDGQAALEGMECRHGVAKASVNIRRRRFRRPLGGGTDLSHIERTKNASEVAAVQRDLLSILTGGIAGSVRVEILEEEVEVGEDLADAIEWKHEPPPSGLFFAPIRPRAPPRSGEGRCEACARGHRGGCGTEDAHHKCMRRPTA